MDTSFLYSLAILFIMGILAVILWRQPVKNLLSSLKTNLHRFRNSLWHKSVKAESTTDIDFKDVCNAVECALARLNVEYELKESRNERVYHLDFQAGHFMLVVPHNTIRGMRLWFPGITTIALDHIDCMRIVCNENNSGNPLVQAVYSTDDKKCQVMGHLVAHLSATWNDTTFEHDFKVAAEDCFQLRGIVIEQIEKLIANANNYAISDIEYHHGCNAKAEQVLTDIELCHTESTLGFNDVKCDNHNELTIGNIMHRLFPLKPHTLKSLEVMGTPAPYSTTSEHDILNYPIAMPLIGIVSQDAKPDHFATKQATLRINYQQYDSTADVPDGIDATLYLMLDAVKQTSEALYFRLTYCTTQHMPTHSKGSSSIEAQAQPFSGSMLLSFDLVSLSQRRAEVKYMQGEAHDKIAEGKKDECSPEQLLISYITDPHVSFNLYWGQRLMRQELYLEASIRLERVWNALNQSFVSLNDHNRQTFHHVCYLLGLCLMHLGLYKEAFYYLEIIASENNSDYLQAYINCLVGAKDARAIQIVENALSPLHKLLQQMNEAEEEIPQHLLKLQNFLKRRQVYLNVEMGYYDKAEKLCKSMLEDAENTDFALKELAHLQRLRGESVSNTHSDNNTQ